MPEMMASILVERTDQPWEFQLDYSRQLWDEIRHAMMGSAAFEARGVDWTGIPLNVGFALRLNLLATPLERQTILYAIEQSLMPAETGKRFEYETAVKPATRSRPTSTITTGPTRCCTPTSAGAGSSAKESAPEQALERAQAIHERTWAALDQYRSDEPPGDWWDALVRPVLGQPSAPQARGARRPQDPRGVVEPMSFRRPPSARPPVTFHLIPHTHWDREWYLTRAAFQARLVPVLDECSTSSSGTARRDSSSTARRCCWRIIWR